jgi:hypothetical protein
MMIDLSHLVGEDIKETIESYLNYHVNEAELIKGNIIALSWFFRECCPSSPALDTLEKELGKEVLPPNLPRLTHDVLFTWRPQNQRLFLKALKDLIVENKKTLKGVRSALFPTPQVKRVVDKVIKMMRPQRAKRKELSETFHAEYYGLIQLISVYVFAGYEVRFGNSIWGPKR